MELLQVHRLKLIMIYKIQLLRDPHKGLNPIYGSTETAMPFNSVQEGEQKLISDPHYCDEFFKTP